MASMNFFSSLLSSAHQVLLAVDEYKLDLTKDKELQKQHCVCLFLLQLCIAEEVAKVRRTLSGFLGDEEKFQLSPFL